MEVIKYQINDKSQVCNIVSTNTALFYRSRIGLVYHAMPGNALLSRTIINFDFTLQKFKMPHKDLSEIENSIYTGTLKIYAEEKKDGINQSIGGHLFFLNGIYVSSEIFLRIDNRLGVNYKNQEDNSLAQIANKLRIYLTPFFMFLLEQDSAYTKELLGKNNEEILKIISEAKNNTKYKITN